MVDYDVDSLLHVYNVLYFFVSPAQPPAVDLLTMSSGMVYGGLGDYGISQMTDVDVYDYLPLTEIMQRSVVEPLVSQ